MSWITKRKDEDMSWILTLAFIHFTLGSFYLLMTLMETFRSDELIYSHKAFALLVAGSIYFLGYIIFVKIPDQGLSDLFWLRDLLLIPIVLSYIGEVIVFFQAETEAGFRLFSTFTIVASILFISRELITED